jgi:uncharacterized protein YndB with AHSA1/START domain
MTDEADGVVRIERTYDAPAEDVFDAWISVEVLKRWWHAELDWETPHAETDVRVGGKLRVVMRNPADGSEYGGGGEYTVIDRPRRLAFTWTWDGDDESQRQLIEIDFIDRGSSTTILLTHSGLPKREQDDYVDGWDKSFQNLEVALRR